MNGLKELHICIKILMIFLIIVAILTTALTAFYAVSLGAWMSYDGISIATRGDIYKAILQITDIGSYYQNISFISSKFAFSLINTTLLIHLIFLSDKILKLNSPFCAEGVSLIRWMTLRIFVFPLIAFVFSVVINLYFNQGFPFWFINVSYLICGIIFLVLSFLLKFGYEVENKSSDF